jgi:Flp pilus assembly protein TadD
VALEHLGQFEDARSHYRTALGLSGSRTTPFGEAVQRRLSRLTASQRAQ